MEGSFARVSSSKDNVNELGRVRCGRTELAAADPTLCPDLCSDFSVRNAKRPARRARKRKLTPTLIDDLRVGKLDDPETGGLAIEMLPSGKKRWRFRRRIAGGGDIVKLSLGLFPAFTIAAAREWANGLNRRGRR